MKTLFAIIHYAGYKRVDIIFFCKIEMLPYSGKSGLYMLYPHPLEN